MQDLLQSFFFNGVIVDQGGARSPAILFFNGVIVDQGGARSPAIPCIVDSCAAAGICLQRGV